MGDEINSGIYFIRVKGTEYTYVGASTVLSDRIKSSRQMIARRFRVPMEQVILRVLERIEIDEDSYHPDSHRVNLLGPLRHREQYWIHKLKPSLNVIHNSAVRPYPKCSRVIRRNRWTASALGSPAQTSVGGFSRGGIG